MISESAAATNLLELLEDWVGNCDLWDSHHGMAANNAYRGYNAESEVYDDLQRNYTLPLMEKCSLLGFEYVDLMQLIPPGFRTNCVQRQQMLEDLQRWAKGEYAL